MKKLVMTFCMLELLFGISVGNFTKQGIEAFDRGEYQKAMELYQKACDNGQIEGCLLLGSMLMGGAGIEKDEQEAMRLLKKTCNEQEKHGCLALKVVGESLYISQKYEDKQKALKIFQILCASKEASTCNVLGEMYEYGEEVKQDKSEAKKFFGKACSLGNEEGCKNYARLNEAGY